MGNNSNDEQISKNEKKMAGLRNLDFILGGILIFVQIVTYVIGSRSGNLSYESGKFIYGILGVILLVMGFLSLPKKKKNNSDAKDKEN